MLASVRVWLDSRNDISSRYRKSLGYSWEAVFEDEADLVAESQDIAKGMLEIVGYV